ncbi:hypothetical protein [Bacillus sp. JCM 19034]|uniref:hypothetical protein n=1 Tax=Bacillus sp. JCM 19034 TaxID=1481928 RepID=UPI000782C6AF|nr:hypothetical protein [Bacillus sp. JCM 19034]
MHIPKLYEDPLYAQLNIYQVQHRFIQSGKTNVQILTFSSKSLIFASDLQFPMSESVVYRICLNIHHSFFELYGYITSIIQSKNLLLSIYEYTYKQDTEMIH